MSALWSDPAVTGLPWPGTVSRRIALILWEQLGPLANLSESDARLHLHPRDLDGPFGAYMNLRAGLARIVSGEWTLRGKAIAAAPLCLISSRGRLGWGVRHVDPAGARRDDLDRVCWFLLGLLALPEVRPLLRRCDSCGAFMLARARRRQRKTARRDFCSAACRRRATSREDNARRQREYRNRLRP